MSSRDAKDELVTHELERELDAARADVEADGGTDALPELDGAADGVTDAGMADVGRHSDGAADGQPDGLPSTDARLPDGSTIADAPADADGPPCPAPTPTCDSINRTDADIHATFTQPCSPEGDRKCGGVVSSATLEAGQYVVETLPLVCKAGAWTLAGSG